MENFKKALKELNELNKLSIPQDLFHELIKITCLSIKNKYIILSPTKRSLDFIKMLSTYDVNIIAEYKDKRKKFVLFDLIKEKIENSNDPINEIFQELKDNCIIIKNDEKMQEFLDSVSMINQLSGKSDAKLGNFVKRIVYVNRDELRYSDKYDTIKQYFLEMLRDIDNDITDIYLSYSDDLVGCSIDYDCIIDDKDALRKEKDQYIEKLFNKMKKEVKQKITYFLLKGTKTRIFFNSIAVYLDKELLDEFFPPDNNKMRIGEFYCSQKPSDNEPYFKFRVYFKIEIDKFKDFVFEKSKDYKEII